METLQGPGFIIGVIFSILFWSTIALIFGGYFLAQKDRFFTFMKEGTAEAILRGEEMEKFLMTWNGYHLNDPNESWYNKDFPDWEVLANKENDKFDLSEWRNSQSLLQKKAGIYWVGIWPFKKVYEYQFEWTEEKQTEEGTYRPRAREALTDFIFVKDFPYHLLLKNVETKEKIPVDVHYVLTVQINNPYKALFRVDDWLKRVIAQANGKVRNYIGKKSFEQLTSEEDNVSEDEKEEPLINAIIKLNESVISAELDEESRKEAEDLLSKGEGAGITNMYGVTIRGADIQSIDPSPGLGAETQKALTAKYVAEREAEAKIADAEGDKKAMILRAEGRSQEIKTVYGQIIEMDEGIELRKLEVLENSGKNGNTILVGESGVSPLLNITPKKE